ncbi:MAG TPA: PAS domain-containing protein [Vicinamibacteria bacterium]|nr:PAS domain-containing protein [Vicinamibacteria bacterium]
MALFESSSDAVVSFGTDGRILTLNPRTQSLFGYREANIPVMMITIVDNPGLGHSLGAVEYLTKPIDWRRLGTALAKYRAAAARVSAAPDTRPSA